MGDRQAVDDWQSQYGRALSYLLTKAMHMDRHYRLSYEIGLRGRAFEEACGLRERSASTLESGSVLTSVGKAPHGRAQKGVLDFRVHIEDPCVVPQTS